MSGQADGPLRISVLSQLDPASPRTNSIADLRLCRGLAVQGNSVELVVPGTTRPMPSSGAVLRMYDLEPNFDVRYLSTPRGNGRSDFWTLLALFQHHILAAGRRSRPPVVIARDIRLLLPYVAVGRLGVQNMLTASRVHEFRKRRQERLVCANSTCILATNSAILHDVASRGISNPRTFVTGNPVPHERVEFGRTYSKADARRQLGLDLDRPVIGYTGKLYIGMRELEYLIEAASRLPEYLFLFTGGRPPVIQRLVEELRDRSMTNIRFAGILTKPEETRFYQQAADVLVAYYSIEDHPYADHNLPNKLAEYMATGNPIVAADFPPVRDVLNPQNGILIKPDDVDALTEALTYAIRCQDESAALGACAQRDVASRTTESVGADLSSFLARVSNPSSGN
jgi:glycosyltransferase involved in cell wall biosynthesis